MGFVEDSIMESEREEDSNHDGLVAQAINRLPSSLASNIQSASDPQEHGGYFHTEDPWVSKVEG